MDLQLEAYEGLGLIQPAEWSPSDREGQWEEPACSAQVRLVSAAMVANPIGCCRAEAGLGGRGDLLKGAECSLGPHGHRTPGGPLSRHVAAMPDVGWGTGVAKTAVDSRAPSSPRREARPRPPCAVLMLGTTFGIQLGARLAGHHYAFLSAGRQQPKRRHTYFCALWFGFSLSRLSFPLFCLPAATRSPSISLSGLHDGHTLQCLHAAGAPRCPLSPPRSPVQTAP